MSLGRERELEFKLQLTHAELKRVRSHPALGNLSAGAPVTRTLRSIYFDTPDHRLRAQGLSLRLRSDGNGWLQTIKGGWRPIEAEDAVKRPEPDLGVIGKRRVRRKVGKAIDSSTLQPVLETVVERTTCHLRSSEGELKRTLDEGVARTGDAQSPVCEAELELKSGGPECLLHAATQLFDATPLRLAMGSQAEGANGPAVSVADGAAGPQRGEQPQLRAGQTCAEAFALIVQSAAAQITANRRAVLETEDPAAAHQLRIGLRRLRSALCAFRPLADTPALRELERRAQVLARSVGELRDADVLIEDICAPVSDVFNDDAGLSRLREALLAHRAHVREQVRSDLCGEQWSVLQLHFALWPRTIDDAEGLSSPVGKLARSALKRRWRKVAESGDRLDDLTIEQRHAMRKGLKTLRYTAEFFATLYPQHATRRFIREIRSLQEVFGYLNDVVAAERLNVICHEHCGDSPEAQRAAGFILGWHNAQAARAWKDAHRGWQKLQALPRFWA
jgi:inorganic triphosphatase YgiF